MSVEQLRLFNTIGGLLFVSLLLHIQPEWVWPVGCAFGLWLCLWASRFRDTIFVWSETRKIDDEHERL